MSTQDKRGAWVIPPEQAKEFLSGPIRYRELVEDCLDLFRTKKLTEQRQMGIVNRPQRGRRSKQTRYR